VSREAFDLDVCGFGSINVDYIVAGPAGDPYFDELSEGEERAVRDATELHEHIEGLAGPAKHIGGSAVNTLRALRAIDKRLRLAIVGPLGNLPAGVSLDELDGIDRSGVVRFDREANACVSVVEGAERKLRPYNDPLGVRTLLVDNRDRTIAVLSRARLIHVTSLIAPEAGPLVGDILASVREMTGDETQISVDLGQPWAEDRAAAEAVLPHAAILLISEEELRALLPGLPSTMTRETESDAVDRLLRRYSCAPGTIAILKRRAQPERADSDDRAAAEPRPRVGGVLYRRCSDAPELLRDEVLRDGLDRGQIVDSTGAGDFFAAGVLAEFVSSHARAVQTLTFATAMARHKFGHTPRTAYDDAERLLYGDTVPPAAGKVFVSHSHEDAKIADAILDGLTAGGGDRERSFFCTSQSDTAIRFGDALDPAVLRNLRAARVVLFLVTKDSVMSPACQRELGAAQVLRIPTVPLKHPEFRDWADMPIPINFHRGAELDHEDQLQDLRDALATLFGWTGFSSKDWEAAMHRLRATLRVAD
jgi:sugar/nucleoside kinase (ribokinase family)